MRRTLPISLNILPDGDMETRNCATLVLTAYTIAMATQRNERKAFEAAIRAWRERNPEAAEGEAARGVASIICNSLQVHSQASALQVELHAEAALGRQRPGGMYRDSALAPPAIVRGPMKGSTPA